MYFYNTIQGKETGANRFAMSRGSPLTPTLSPAETVTTVERGPWPWLR